MDDIRHSLSKMKKKVEHRITGRKRKPNGTGTNPGGEGASLPGPEPQLVEGESYDGEGDRAKVAEEPVSSMDQFFQSESVPARGDDNGQEGGGVDVDGEEAGQKHLHLHSDIEVAVGSGRSGEPEGIYPSPSTLDLT